MAQAQAQARAQARVRPSVGCSVDPAQARYVAVVAAGAVVMVCNQRPACWTMVLRLPRRVASHAQSSMPPPRPRMMTSALPVLAKYVLRGWGFKCPPPPWICHGERVFVLAHTDAP